MKKQIIGIVFAAAVLSGCSTTVGTHQEAKIPAPTISTTDSIANVEVGEQVRGRGCANRFLLFFHYGDSQFLEAYGSYGDSAVDRAKAAAAFDAMDTGDRVNNDMLIYPVWEVGEARTFFGLISKNVCAEVVGYRASIQGFDKADTLTAPQKASNDGLFGSFGFWNTEQSE